MTAKVYDFIAERVKRQPMRTLKTGKYTPKQIDDFMKKLHEMKAK